MQFAGTLAATAPGWFWPRTAPAGWLGGARLWGWRADRGTNTIHLVDRQDSTCGKNGHTQIYLKGIFVTVIDPKIVCTAIYIALILFCHKNQAVLLDKKPSNRVFRLKSYLGGSKKSSSSGFYPTKLGCSRWRRIPMSNPHLMFAKATPSKVKTHQYHSEGTLT